MATAAATSALKDASYVRKKEEVTRAARSHGVNVSFAERVVSGALGGVLVGLGLNRRGIDGLALAGVGAALGFRAFTGHCPVYGALGINSDVTDREQLQDDATPFGVPAHSGVHVESSIQINRPAEELYAYWRNHANLAKFIPYIESVTSTDGIHSHWVMKGPAGVTVEWYARIHTDDPWHALSWASTHGQISNAGSVRFKGLPGQAASQVHLNMRLDPPAGTVGLHLATLLGLSPDNVARDALRRFKQLMETGEVVSGS